MKYLLLAIIFTQQPDAVGIKFLSAHESSVECSAQRDIHNKVVEDTDIDERLVCIPAKI